jgi:hypothetical protein
MLAVYPETTPSLRPTSHLVNHDCELALSVLDGSRIILTQCVGLDLHHVWLVTCRRFKQHRQLRGRSKYNVLPHRMVNSGPLTLG